MMFADDTSLFIKSLNNSQLQSGLNTAICKINKWFQDNFITLNLNKTYFIQFLNKNLGNPDIQIKIENKQIEPVKETNFLGLIIDDKLSWKGHIDYMIPKLSLACYVMRTVEPYVSHNTCKIIYYSYFQSIMNYGILFWGSSTESIKIFKLQKKIIRTMLGYKKKPIMQRIICELGILPLHSQYILSLLMFLFKNKHQFPVNTDIHQYATRHQSNFHKPLANLTKYQKGICYLGIKVFNKLPPYIKDEFGNFTKIQTKA
jgi:hypothetical protein